MKADIEAANLAESVQFITNMTDGDGCVDPCAVYRAEMSGLVKLPAPMWCKVCRQEVPGIASMDAGQFCCARCGAVIVSGCRDPLAAKEQVEAAGPDEVPPANRLNADSACQPFEPLPIDPLDSWELDEKLRHVERVLHGGRFVNHSLGGEQAVLRYDAVAPTTTPSQDRQPRSRGAASAIAWLLLAAAVAAFTCGAVLAGWGVVAARDDLWDLGLPIVLVAQVALLIALVMHLDVLAGHRRADDDPRPDDTRPTFHSTRRARRDQIS